MRSPLRATVGRALATGLLACLAGPLAAETPEAVPPSPEAVPAAPAEAGADADPSWQERLERARERIERARERESAASAAYSRARHDRYPRGEALDAIEQERRAAGRELRAAEAALPELVEQARRAGVAPGLLEPSAE